MSTQPEPAEPNSAGATTTARERRRPGRVEYSNPALISLLRQPSLNVDEGSLPGSAGDADLNFDPEDQPDDLAPARAIITAIPIGLGIWALIALGVWLIAASA